MIATLAAATRVSGCRTPKLPRYRSSASTATPRASAVCPTVRGRDPPDQVVRVDVPVHVLDDQLRLAHAAEAVHRLRQYRRLRAGPQRGAQVVQQSGAAGEVRVADRHPAPDLAQALRRRGRLRDDGARRLRFGRASPVVPAGPVQAAPCRAVHAQPAGHGVDPVVQLLGPGAADRLGEPADERQQVRYPVDRAGYLFQPAQQGRYVAPIGRRRRLTRLDQVGHRLGDLRRRDDGQQAGERPGG